MRAAGAAPKRCAARVVDAMTLFDIGKMFRSMLPLHQSTSTKARVGLTSLRSGISEVRQAWRAYRALRPLQSALRARFGACWTGLSID
eukprot:2320157-Pyramimonas_sp.AAC.1